MSEFNIIKYQYVASCARVSRVNRGFFYYPLARTRLFVVANRQSNEKPTGRSLPRTRVRIPNGITKTATMRSVMARLIRK